MTVTGTPIPVVLTQSHDFGSWLFSPAFGGACAVIAAVIAFYAAGRQARAIVKAQEISAESARHIEEVKREHFDEGLRRKLMLLMKRSSSRIILAIATYATDPEVWSTSIGELAFVMTPELASAMSDDKSMLRAYDVLDRLEVAKRLSAGFYSALCAKHDEVVESVGDPELAGSMWNDRAFATMIGYLVPPAKALLEYWRLADDAESANEIEAAIARAEQEIRRFSQR